MTNEFIQVTCLHTASTIRINLNHIVGYYYVNHTRILLTSKIEIWETSYEQHVSETPEQIDELIEQAREA